MHPEIVQIGPGSCPKCGMALVPVAGAEEENAELRDMTRRFWASAALSAPLLLIAMAPYFGATRSWPYVEFVLGTPVVLWGGWPFFHKFWLSLKNRSPNMYTLIGLGVALAYAFSVAAVFAPGLFPSEFRMHGGEEVGAYFEAAAVIVTLVLLGEVMLLRALGQTSQAIRQLLALAPNTALRLEANVGIAMGTGTDVAIESAGVTLVKGDLRAIVKAIRLSRATMRNVKQNLFFAFLYNALGVPLAAGVLYPFFGLLLSPIFAGAAMALSSVSVVTNALRLRRVRL